MRKVAYVAGWLLALGGCVFFAEQLWRQRDAFATMLSMNGATAAAFVVSGLLFSLIYPLTGWGSARILSDLDAPARPLILIGVLCVSQLARYVPGNVGQHLARGALLSARGVRTSAIVVSFSIEIVLALLAALVLAALALAFGFAERVGAWDWRIAALVVAACVGLAVLAMWFDKILPRRLADKLSLGSVRKVSWGTCAACVAVYLLNYVLVGSGLALIGHAIGVPLSLPLAIGAFAVAWVAGFLAPGLPAGIGVREAVLVAILAPTSGAAAIVVVATLHRLSTVFGDLIAALLGVLLLRVHKDANLSTQPREDAHP
jgi:uncharacterized membrane protein YbhN (UPF0104 family)